MGLLRTESDKSKNKTQHQKYYVCERCGYVTIIRDSYCPICAKEGVKVKTN
jgi:rubrerythrin